MRYKLATLAILFVFALTTIAQNHIPNQLIVQLQYNQDVNALLKNVNSHFENAHFEVEKVLSKRINIWLLSYNEPTIGNTNAIEWLENNEAVYLAQVNHTNVKLRGNNPDDAQFSTQWCHINDGLGQAVLDADMDSDSAWTITTGGLTANGDTIVVAVIDGGQDIDHEDLDFWVNKGEIAGNNIDDDNNGYIDDIHGWNTHNNNGDINASGFWDSHGTHVSGIIGAKGNNGIGIAGVNWNVKIMGINGSATDEATVVASYGYVLEQRARYNETNGAEGAFVVSTNSSFGIDDANPNDYPIWCGFYDSLGVEGILSAVAGPNRNSDIDAVGDVPGACPSNYTISVTNLRNNNTRNSSAGYGIINCDIAAPGTDINSTLPDDAYGEQTGTSMATPQVAGAIALLHSAAPSDLYNNSPAEQANVVKDYIMTEGFDSVPDLQGKCVTGGRLDLFKGVNAIQTYTFGGGTGAQLRELISNDFSIYPNPTSGTVSIQLTKLESIIITDISGKVVYTKQPTALNPQLKLTNLNSGIYFVTVGGNTKRLVKL